MASVRSFRAFLPTLAVLSWASAVSVAGVFAQAPGSTLPSTAPTSLPSAGITAPIAATAGAGTYPDPHHHRAQVSCTAGQLSVHADNSSLNGILRAVAHCTGMRITGGVADQRVFGNYGPAAPATVLTTLLDGTGTNMLLLETAENQPAELVLTPRTGGITPPSPNTVADDDVEAQITAPAAPAGQPGTTQGQPAAAQGQPAGPLPTAAMPGNNTMANGNTTTPNGSVNQTPVPTPNPGAPLTGPASMPQPINNVNGSPSNTTPTVGSYPTTDAVPLDSLPTPSTTPSVNGIVDSPNPPAPGSDTAKLLQGTTANVPGATTLIPGPTGNATQPGGTNTTTPVPTGTTQPGVGSMPASQTGAPSTAAAPSNTLTPQQVYQQLQQIRQQQQQQPAPAAPTSTPQ